MAIFNAIYLILARYRQTELFTCHMIKASYNKQNV